MNAPDLTGKVFGFLTILERTPNDMHGNATWLVQCKCGNITKIKTTNLIHQTRSCGCVRKKTVYRLTEVAQIY